MDTYNEHSIRPRRETRDDKYGHKYRLVCKCGKATNWHTAWWRAEDVFYGTKHSELKNVDGK